MLLVRPFFVTMLAAALGGCGLIVAAQQQKAMQERQQQIAALNAQGLAAASACNDKFPSGHPKTVVARIQCMNDALAITLPVQPHPDLLQALMAERVAIAEKIQTGKMTIAEGNAAMSQKWSETVAEDERRTLAERDTAAQEQSAMASRSAAAAGWARAAAANQANMRSTMPTTTTCMGSGTYGGGTFGGMTTCNSF